MHTFDAKPSLAKCLGEGN